MHPPVDDLAAADAPLLVPQGRDTDALELPIVFAGLLGKPVAHQEVAKFGQTPGTAAAGRGRVGGGVGWGGAVGLTQAPEREVASDIGLIVSRARRVE